MAGAKRQRGKARDTGPADHVNKNNAANAWMRAVADAEAGRCRASSGAARDIIRSCFSCAKARRAGRPFRWTSVLGCLHSLDIQRWWTSAAVHQRRLVLLPTVIILWRHRALTACLEKPEHCCVLRCSKAGCYMLCCRTCPRTHALKRGPDDGRIPPGSRGT
ncbi:hypothetical protein TCAP_05867 [Tolypocladium capitatum]|uniref:Uncharacterized protein n=1 Tax=Tolypocladium capitatum TaxID=45235 RepID=A0A2K3Q9G3_9HYPO|nr:hypothetical protein TCAP_05867 [Tolypocladium capitatum]